MTLVPTTPTDPGQLVETVAALEEHNALLTEAVADLEIAAEDRGWKALGAELDRELSREGLAAVARNCEIMAIASPLIKRGLQLRVGYIWGQGVTLQARATGGDQDAGQDVNATLQAFLDDPINRAAFSGPQAREQNERTLGTKGNLFFALFPNPLTGAVQIRRVPFEEITDKLTNPDDREDVWFYFRTYTVSVVEAGYSGTRRRRETRRVLHPAMGFWPQTRPKTVDGLPVLWDQPIKHVNVNRPDAAKWGIPDAYAALPWARAYDGFLTDWAKLVKALSKFAWKLTGDRSSKTQRAMGRLRGLTVPGGPEGTAPALGPSTAESPAGGVVGMGPGQNLEAIPKTGATIDSESGRPLAAMVAAALGIPVTTLLADPGTTGARAVAETLDKPTILEMNGRRELWTSVLTDICGFVVDQAIRAPRGPLSGTVVRDQATGVETVTLAGGAERTIVVDWPDLNELDPVQLVTAIVSADSTGKLPPVETLRLLLAALRVRDADEIIEKVTDENGEFIDPQLAAAAAAIADQRRRGRDTPPPSDDTPPANDTGEPAEDA